MQDTVVLGLRWIDIITVLAILVGPILAVGVDRLRQSRTDGKARKLGVFRSLMRTRRSRLDPEHVGALNLIDLEFYGRTGVMSAFKAYMDHLATPLPAQEAQERYFEQREDLLVQLLHQMGRDLGYQFDKRDLEKLAYGPVAWATEQDMQRQNMVLFHEILSGKRALPVTAMQPPAANPFPPAPAVNP